MPVVPAGDVTVIDVAESAVTVPATVPNLTEVAPERPVPVTVTVVPPAVGSGRRADGGDGGGGDVGELVAGAGGATCRRPWSRSRRRVPRYRPGDVTVIDVAESAVTVPAAVPN